MRQKSEKVIGRKSRRIRHETLLKKLETLLNYGDFT
jgi:hypothetical protein